MKISFSWSSVIDENYQLRITKYCQRCLSLNYDGDIVRDIPPIIKECGYRIKLAGQDIYNILVLTVDGYLMLIDNDHPSGRRINLPFYVEWMAACCSDKILIKDEDGNLHYEKTLRLISNLDNEKYRPFSTIIDRNVTSINSSHNLIYWINSDRESTLSIFNNGIIRHKMKSQPVRLLRGMMVDEDNYLYRLDSFRHTITKLFQVDYYIADAAYNLPLHHITTIDNRGRIRYYNYSFQEVNIGPIFGKRIIYESDLTDCIELSDGILYDCLGEIHKRPYSVLETNYSSMKIKSATG